MKVSVISGVYNAEKYLRKCIESILKQTYKEIEIILVVNASYDGSKNIVEEYALLYPEKIKAIYTEEKLGAGGSRQLGMKYATGEYVCFIDCDDELTDDSILQMVKVAEESKNCDIVICNFEKVKTNGEVIYVRKFKSKQQAIVQGIAPWGKIYRLKFLKENELFFRNFPFGEDILFASHLYLTKPKIELCNYIGYLWLDNPKSTSHTELRGFPEFTIEKAQEYFDYLSVKYEDAADVLSYFKFKYFVWYLLQSGRNVSKQAMISEYNHAFAYLCDSSSDWNKFRKCTVYWLKGERSVVKMVLLCVRLLEKLHISKKFFVIYSQSFWGKFWPSL